MKLLSSFSIPIGFGTVLMGWDLHHREASAFESAVFNALNQNFFALAMCVFIIGYFYRCNREFIVTEIYYSDIYRRYNELQSNYLFCLTI